MVSHIKVLYQIPTHAFFISCMFQHDSDSDAEEWDRHEAFYDDAANIERNKERLYEEKIELKWEKGGSGLVFYTDAQYWKQLEGGEGKA